MGELLALAAGAADTGVDADRSPHPTGWAGLCTLTTVESCE